MSRCRVLLADRGDAPPPWIFVAEAVILTVLARLLLRPGVGHSILAAAVYGVIVSAGVTAGLAASRARDRDAIGVSNRARWRVASSAVRRGCLPADEGFHRAVRELAHRRAAQVPRGLVLAALLIVAAVLVPSLAWPDPHSSYWGAVVLTSAGLYAAWTSWRTLVASRAVLAAAESETPADGPGRHRAGPMPPPP